MLYSVAKTSFHMNLSKSWLWIFWPPLLSSETPQQISIGLTDSLIKWTLMYWGGAERVF